MLRWNGLAAVLLFAALTGVVALQVLNRFVLHLPLLWSEEVARFLFFWVVLLGAAMSVRHRRHFVLDLWGGRRADRETPRSARRAALDAVPHLAVLGFCVFLLIEGTAYARTGLLRTATNSSISMGLVYAAIPVFAALAIVYAAQNLAADLRAGGASAGMRDDGPAGARDIAADRGARPPSAE